MRPRRPAIVAGAPAAQLPAQKGKASDCSGQRLRLGTPVSTTSSHGRALASIHPGGSLAGKESMDAISTRSPSSRTASFLAWASADSACPCMALVRRVGSIVSLGDGLLQTNRLPVGAFHGTAIRRRAKKSAALGTKSSNQGCGAVYGRTPSAARRRSTPLPPQSSPPISPPSLPQIAASCVARSAPAARASRASDARVNERRRAA